MTSPISAEFVNRRRFGGFTLAEMLVVMGIIILLMALLVPIVIRARRVSHNTRRFADLQAIGNALEHYRQDVGEYPPIGTVDGGAAALGRALIAPDGVALDGFDGAGFRMRSTTQVLGPYLQPDKWRLTGTKISRSDNDKAKGIFILYYLARPVMPNIYIVNGYVNNGPNSLYNSVNNSQLTLQQLRAMLGDINNNGAIGSGTELPAWTGPYILWSTGLDGVMGPVNSSGQSVTSPTADDIARSDDITNFTNGVWPVTATRGGTR